VRSVVIMNEDVIDDATEVVASLFAWIGRGFRRVAPAKAPVAVTAGTAGVRVDEGRFDRVRTGLVLGMVALLGLIVLSSVVLS